VAFRSGCWALAKDRFRVAASKQNPLSFDQKSTGLLIRRRVNSLPQVRILSSPLTQALKVDGPLIGITVQPPLPVFFTLVNCKADCKEIL